MKFNEIRVLIVLIYYGTWFNLRTWNWKGKKYREIKYPRAGLN